MKKQIGIITNTKGIKGNLLISGCQKGIFLKKGSKIFVGFSENFAEEFILADDFIGKIKNSDLLLVDINSKEKAEKLKEKGIFANKNDILQQNEKFIFKDEIINCDVFDIEKKSNIGKIVDILELPANNVWIVATAQGLLPLPVIDDVIKKVDLTNKIVEIFLIDGLLDIIFAE